MANNVDEEDAGGASGSATPAATASTTKAGTDPAVSLVPRSQTKNPNKKKKRPGFRPKAKPTPSKVANKAGSNNNKAAKSNKKQTPKESNAGLKPAPLEQDQDATTEGDKEGGLKEPPTATAVDDKEKQASTTDAAASSNEQNAKGSKEKRPSTTFGINSSAAVPTPKPTGLKKAPPNSSLAHTEVAAPHAATTTAAATATATAAAIGTTLRRRGRSNSISSTATASSRKRLASSIRVGVTRTPNVSTRSTVRFEGLPLQQQQQQRQQQNEGATLVFQNRNEDDTHVTLGEPDGSTNAVGTTTMAATDATSLVTTTTMTDMTPPSSTALVAAAAAAAAAGDRAVSHDQELLERLAAEITDQPQLGSFCKTVKKSKRKNEKDDDAAAAADVTGAKKGKRRKKKKNSGNETIEVEGTSATAVTALIGEGTEMVADTSVAAAPAEGDPTEGAVDVAKDTAKEEPKEAGPDDPAMEGSAAAAPVGVPLVQIVNGEIVLQESSLVLPTRRTIREVEEEFQDNVVEEDAQPAIVNASYSSFRTKRGGNGAISSGKRGPHHWTVKETQKFYSALRMLGTDFGSMEALFDNKRTRRQLKYKYRTELSRNPSLVEDLALNPKFKSEIDISFFNVEVDPKRIKALENEEPPAYEPTDVVVVTDENEQAEGNTATDQSSTAETAEAGKDGTMTNCETGNDAVENETRFAEADEVDTSQKQASAGNIEEKGGEVLEVVEEDAEEERLAAVAAAKSTKPPPKKVQKTAKSKTKAKTRPPSTPTKRPVKSTKNEGEKPRRPADDQRERPSRKDSFQEAQDELAGLDEGNTDILLEEDFDMPMGDEEEPLAAATQPGAAAGKAPAALSAKTHTATKKRRPKPSPRKNRSEKVSVVGKKSTGAKVKRPKIRPSPGKKKKT